MKKVITPQQQEFFKEFDKALTRFLEVKKATSIPWPTEPNGGNLIINKIKTILDECPNRNDIIKCEQIKIPNCPLTIIVIEIFGNVNHLNGIWIIVSDGNFTLAFHFPLNAGINVILHVTFESNPILRAIFVNAHAAPHAFLCLFMFFNNPFTEFLIPFPPANPVNITNFSLAFDVIYRHCLKIFCNPIAKIKK